jgi:hypothetical protein
MVYRWRSRTGKAWSELRLLLMSLDGFSCRTRVRRPVTTGRDEERFEPAGEMPQARRCSTFTTLSRGPVSLGVAVDDVGAVTNGSTLPAASGQGHPRVSVRAASQARGEANGGVYVPRRRRLRFTRAEPSNRDYMALAETDAGRLFSRGQGCRRLGRRLKNPRDGSTFRGRPGPCYFRFEPKPKITPPIPALPKITCVLSTSRLIALAAWSKSRLA